MTPPGAPAAPRAVPRAPRRVSGPARGRPGRRARPTLGARALAGVRALPDHRVVDRLIRGRLWIGLVACLLLGLVTMQVALLKLNAGIGRAVQQGATLDRRNGELRAEISRLGSEERIQAMGAKLGLIMPDAGHVTYLGARPGQDPAAALQALRANRLGPAAAAPAPTQASSPASDQGTSGAAGTDPSTGAGQSTPAATAPADAAAGGDPNAAGGAGGAGDQTSGDQAATGAGGAGPQG